MKKFACELVILSFLLLSTCWGGIISTNTGNIYFCLKLEVGCSIALNPSGLITFSYLSAT